jgi:hypothetical protein
MKSLILTTAFALALSTVSAGLGFGACPTVTSIPYSADMQTTRNHNLLYIDKASYTYMNLARKIVAAIPDVSCLALGQFPYPDAATYDGLYVTASTLLSFKMLYFDVATLSEVQYACFDYSNIASYVATLTLPVPSWLVNIGLQVLRLGHFDISFIFTNSASFTTPEIATITTGIQAKFPTFAWNSLALLDRTACP